MPRPRKNAAHLFTRHQGGADRYYADLRSLGGGRVALVPRGETQATTDPVIAAKLFSDLLEKHQKQRRNRALLEIEREAELQSYAAHHLVLKARSGKVTTSWLENSERMLRRAVEFFGAGRELDTISVADVQRYVTHLQGLPNGRGGTLGPSSLRDHLTALSNLYVRAAGEQRVPPGFNPVASLIDKPAMTRGEARWLEVPDAALLLEAARRYQARGDDRALPFSYPLLATFLLTGGRESEVLGLEVADVSFDRKTVTFRPHAHRRLKTLTSHRVVPLWPQLEEILRAHVFGAEQPLGSLLFPSMKALGEAMIQDWRKTLDGIAALAGWEKGEIRTKMFRHTYCAARLQTTDQGAPVSVYTVSRELGHGGEAITRKVYAHLGTVRHRSEVVEYRLENHLQLPGFRERAERVFDTNPGTAGETAPKRTKKPGR